ncbi:hypothetical protein F8388_013062 [Cannabis sativa]|uniref:Retrotransposon Copia-like N-terminal domain-containing protein n=1 Tax=Cannabis sativa TaxID=3483 RepID=A0A7J6EB31_CANSA|nr:hypothetical protein F8388_013062 [Cannabis sativa]
MTDHPGLSLVTPVLSAKNFQPWKRDFKLSIRARNKTPFLEGFPLAMAIENQKTPPIPENLMLNVQFNKTLSL